MKTATLLLIFVWAGLLCRAAGEWTPAGSRQAGMGYTCVALSDAWSAVNNPAGMAFCENTSAAFYYENRFLVRSMAQQTGAFTLRTRYGTLGATLGYTGDALYHSLNSGLGFALKLGNRFAAGIRLDYLSTALGEEYGKRSNVTFDAGIQLKITEKLAFGVQVCNPFEVKLADYAGERIPSVYRAGFAYTLSDRLIFAAEVHKTSGFAAGLRTGAECRISKSVYARIGLCTAPVRYTFGFGTLLKQFRIDISSAFHPQLGYSPQVSLSYSF
jgi:hypothetical protein